jgi:DNA-directed RNA polymerase specialized sigma24 family protein
MGPNPPASPTPGADRSGPEPIAELVRRAAGRCPEASRLLFEHYGEAVTKVIRRRFLTPRHPLRRRIDSDDLLQLAFADLFRRIEAGGTFAGEQELLNFLLCATSHHFCDEYRAGLAAQKRSLKREEPLEALRHDRPVAGADPAAETAARDEFLHRLRGLPPPQWKQLREVWECQPEELARLLGVGLPEAKRYLE